MTYQQHNPSALTHYGLGAISVSPAFDYAARAAQLASAALAGGSTGSYATVELGLNGANPIVKTWLGVNTAGDAFDTIAKTPSRSLAYVAMFDTKGATAEQYFGVTQSIQTTVTLEKLKSLAPVILGVGVLIAGVVWLSRSQKKTSKKSPHGRRRRASAWRRRVTTTWR